MRIRRFDITADCLKMFLGPERIDWQVTKNAIPKDAELVRIHVIKWEDSTPGRLALFYTHPTFPDLPEGTRVEAESIWVTRYHGKEGET